MAIPIPGISLPRKNDFGEGKQEDLPKKLIEAS